MKKKNVLIISGLLVVVGGIVIYMRKKKASASVSGGVSATVMPSGSESSPSIAIQPNTAVTVGLGLKSGTGLWVEFKTPSDIDKFKVGDKVALTGGSYKNKTGAVTKLAKNQLGENRNIVYLSVPYSGTKELVTGTLEKL